MVDVRIRRLERRWQETGDPRDEADWIRARLRADDFQRADGAQAVLLAAALGDPGSQIVVDWPHTNWSEIPWVNAYHALSLHMREAALRIGLTAIREAVDRVWYPAWDDQSKSEFWAMLPDRDLPARLIMVAEAILEYDDLQGFSSQLTAVTDELDDAEREGFGGGGPFGALQRVIFACRLLAVDLSTPRKSLNLILSACMGAMESWIRITYAEGSMVTTRVHPDVACFLRTAIRNEVVPWLLE